MPHPPRAARSLLLVLLLALAIFSVVGADFSLEEWHYTRAVTVPAAVGQEGLVELVLDREVFAGSARERESFPFAVSEAAVPSPYDLADLRLVRGMGQEVPYKLEVLRGQEQRSGLPAVLLQQTYLPGQHASLTADLRREGTLHNEVELHVRSRNLRRTATVETSADAASWKVVAQQDIYDFAIEQRLFSVTSTRIRYPESQARYIRVRVAETEGEPLEVPTIAVFRVQESPARKASYPTTLSQREERDGSTLLTLDTGAQGLPHSRVELGIAEGNFSREVTLEASSDGERWVPLAGGGIIFSYGTPQFVGREVTVAYRETAHRYLRLMVDNQDSPPLTISAATVTGDRARLVFLAEPGVEYRLYYGSAGARRPLYDLERLFPFLLSQELLQARLGPETTNPGFLPPEPPLTERYPWLLRVAVTVMAVLLLLLALGLIRQVRKVLPPPSIPS